MRRPCHAEKNRWCRTRNRINLERILRRSCPGQAAGLLFTAGRGDRVRQLDASLDTLEVIAGRVVGREIWGHYGITAGIIQAARWRDFGISVEVLLTGKGAADLTSQGWPIEPGTVITMTVDEEDLKPIEPSSRGPVTGGHNQEG